MADKVVPRQVARLGRTVRLQCPVEGDPPPLTMWTKDGRTIHGGWSRFRVLPQGLKVKEVEPEDAGAYVCKATNGFGSLSVNYTLIVMGQCRAFRPQRQLRAHSDGSVLGLSAPAGRQHFPSAHRHPPSCLNLTTAPRTRGSRWLPLVRDTPSPGLPPQAAPRGGAFPPGLFSPRVLPA